MTEIPHIRQPQRSGLLYILLTLLIVSAGLFTAVPSYPSMSLEHGFMENIQAIGLLASCGLFLYYSKSGALQIAQPLAWSLTLFCLTFFLLEFDTRPFDIATLTAITNGTIRNVWLGLLWVSVGLLVFKNIKQVWPVFTAWLTSLSGLCMCVAGAFWIASRLLEDGGYSYVISPFFLEELMEVNAVILMVLSAYLTSRDTQETNLY